MFAAGMFLLVAAQAVVAERTVKVSSVQRAEIIYQNSVRNALASEDVFTQMRLLGEAKLEISKLKEELALDPKEKKEIDRRLKRLARMMNSRSQ